MIARTLKPFVVATVALLASCGPPVVVATPAPVTARPNIAGNWLVAVENPTDGTFRRTYFTLDQTGDQISGTIKNNNSRVTINESTWDSTAFSITSVTRNGNNERRTTYDGHLVGNELHFVMRRRAPGTKGVSQRSVSGTRVKGAATVQWIGSVPAADGLLRSPSRGFT